MPAPPSSSTHRANSRSTIGQLDHDFDLDSHERNCSQLQSSKSISLQSNFRTLSHTHTHIPTRYPHENALAWCGLHDTWAWVACRRHAVWHNNGSWRVEKLILNRLLFYTTPRYRRNQAKVLSEYECCVSLRPLHSSSPKLKDQRSRMCPSKDPLMLTVHSYTHVRRSLYIYI